ncbi:alpha/beta hydrolase [Alloacidobacterium dinghuense]|uniref:Alpha/beta hydrolase n=1 Tax=Alloacidobacterium dinghuense TaxID=2763107 RepID=A0A7G8BPC4_9BACT|nr:alpha/beta hydrolase [Alloacidobacterium dinghuense]QNI34394.1 alpha/beta hydrolase [Alloacidobacterium dinghuense]
MPKKSPTRNEPRLTAKQARAAGWPSGSNDPLRPQQELVSGKWLLSALGIVLGVAAICAYGTLCLLFYQGSWQFIFHPSRTVRATPDVPFQEIQFDYTETGKPQLTGWWIPAEAQGRFGSATILFLHDGRGSLSDAVLQLQSLHSIGINVFACDYRGFGKSADLHPSEASMNQDVDAAFEYLTGTRHQPAHSIVIHGVGLGAPVAASAAARHPETAALILENISPTASTLFSADARATILPVRILTSDRFNPIKTLKKLQTPKLFLERGGNAPTQDAYSTATAPKLLFEVASEDWLKYPEVIQGFLDEVLSHQ